MRPAPIFRRLKALVLLAAASPASGPLTLLALVILAYGLRIASLGFYWDDLPNLWFYQKQGIAGISASFAGDRPFLALIYSACLTLFGQSALAWQAFALATRWLCALGLWWVAALVWPGKRDRAFYVAALFAVYPGFSQQWIAVVYGQAFVLFAALFFSLGITLWLARRPGLSPLVRVLGTCAALGLSAFHMFSTEYFFGLELLRPVMLGMVFAQARIWEEDPRKKTGRALVLRVMKWWAPYLVLMLLFVVWRGFIHTFPGKSLAVVEQAAGGPVKALASLAQVITGDLVESTVFAWGRAADLSRLFIEDGAPWGRWLLVFVVTAVFLWVAVIAIFRKEATQDAASRLIHRSEWWASALLLGLFAFFVSGWPFWITGLPMRMGWPQDRYALPLSVGVSLIFAGLVDFIALDARRKALLLSLLAALAVGYHSEHSVTYSQDWTNYKNLVWQMAWRAPSMKPGTLLLTEAMGLKYYEDDSLTGSINALYDPANSSSEFRYLLWDLPTRRFWFETHRLEDQVEFPYRGFTFRGSTAQSLVVSYNPPGCLRIYDPAYDRGQNLLPDQVQLLLPLSNPRAIISESGSPVLPSAALAGPEPKHRWCFFFEKADLARQQKDWQGITRLYEESERLSYGPRDPTELFVFIEAYARLGRRGDAARLTLEAYQKSAATQPMLCSLWRRAAGVDGPPQLNCEVP